MRNAPAASQQLAESLTSLDWASQQMYAHLSTIFLAIEKVSTTEPNLAASLARLGAYVTEAAVADLDAVGISLDRTMKEVH
ncbi:Mrp family chromosome partitioning ATPase [Paraburkholderia bannensis]|uniref:Mrp family chromosome partitioning ATPase n=1 Tax=Paraburkholderia bannensis TaxID=765414 RepID=A0A7W9TYW3_9BURK|nr:MULTISPECIES: hypothetical protein [Paraburkholderia]MBB3258238.1 Mrp family chromosome partitioning ATPase [Paraburkholderia sp. WP4_3_2]MBB6103251.1 Mrp family chromosome partitioning ATPase [Paraburkholderia bannensis]